MSPLLLPMKNQPATSAATIVFTVASFTVTLTKTLLTAKVVRKSSQAVFRIDPDSYDLILGLLDPDPYLFCTDPDLAPSIKKKIV
jgi:hypothetical protein